MALVLDSVNVVRRLLGLDSMQADGGKGSGNFGHKGRPGHVGGSGGGGSKSVSDPVHKLSVFEQSTGAEEKIDWPKAGRKITREEHRELKRYAKSNGIELRGFKDSDVDIESAREAIDALGQMVELFPDIVGDKMHPLTISLEGFMRSVDFAGIGAEEPLHVIRINKDAYRNRAALLKEYEEAAKEGFFVKGTDVRSIIYHEVGHIIANKRNVDGLAIMREILNKGLDKEVLLFCRKNLSIYAGSSGEEIIAECFSAYYGLKDPPQFVIDFMERVR